ncbi:MAG: hypothetical protein D6778_07190 [Nitrospirae bacterium]|nr:MAG: hypothetical protein D6778_07190 [Nitrospirota bacterium]
MAKKQFWIIVTIVMFFLGFMLGYAVPPFMEVGMTSKSSVVEEEGSISPQEADLMKQYQKMLEEGGEGE